MGIAGIYEGDGDKGEKPPTAGIRGGTGGGGVLPASALPR